VTPLDTAFYTPEELESAARGWPQQEVANAFATYRAAVDLADHDSMASMLTTGGRGGNATYGLCHDPMAYKQFLQDNWLDVIPNYALWNMIDGGRVVTKWREVLPGTAPSGSGYDYFGINELIYAGEGQFRLMYSIPDLFGLTLLYRRWKADEQDSIYGDLYPGLDGSHGTKIQTA
jgi:hypothetical protein